MKIWNIYKGLLLSIILCFSITTSAYSAVCFLPGDDACDDVVGSGPCVCETGTEECCEKYECSSSLGEFSTKALCEEENVIANAGTITRECKAVERQGNVTCYVSSCLPQFASSEACANAHNGTCQVHGGSGCWLPVEIGEVCPPYAYLDNKLLQNICVRSMGSADGCPENPLVASGKTIYKISALTAHPAMNEFVTCDYSAVEAANTGITSKTIGGTVESKLFWNDDWHTCSSILERLNECPVEYAKCNTEKGYYDSMADCEAKNGLGNCTKTSTGFADKNCYMYYEECPTPYTGTCDNIICDTENHQIAECSPSIKNSLGVACAKCICGTGYDDVETCNWLTRTAEETRSVMVEASSNGTDCFTMGYTWEPTELAAKIKDTYGYTDTSLFHCRACPYDGTKWKCEPKFTWVNCSAEGYTTDRAEAVDLMDLGWHSCEQCPSNAGLYKCASIPSHVSCPDHGYNITEFEKDAYTMDPKYSCTGCPADTYGFYKCEIDPSKIIPEPEEPDVPEPKVEPVAACPSGFSTSVDLVCDHSIATSRYVAYSSEIIREGNEVPACYDDAWLRQWTNSYSIVSSCWNYGVQWTKYRCAKGYVNGELCLSTNTVIRHEGSPEPCGVLYGASPATGTCWFNQ